jgi:transcriptional regulator with GAF, ATPase, and Fis domain
VIDSSAGPGLVAALSQVASAISDALAIEQVWDRVGDACRTIVPFDAMGIVRVRDDGSVQPLAATGDVELRRLVPQRFFRRDFSPRFWPDADDFLVVVRDAAIDLDPTYPNDKGLIASPYRSALRVNVSLATTPRLGSILLLARAPGQFTEAHGEALKSVAALIAVALAHQQLAERLAEESRHAAVLHARAELLDERVRTLAGELERATPHSALGDSTTWRAVLKQAALVAPTETTVLIAGESGTGKEVVARLIHRGSLRKGHAFAAVNCAALPDQLLESELFGHERGAFTGAVTTRIGLIEQASGGTLFLDEVGEMSPSVQAKFLRVLQEREFQRLGGARTLKADVRVLAATNRDLKRAMAAGTFREDLYYRLAVFDLHTPPLRDRAEDILLLAEHFASTLAQTLGRPAARMHEQARTALVSYRWPGNVRELRNVLERAVILCEDGEIRLEHLPIDLGMAEPVRDVVERVTPSAVTADAAERALILDALARSGNNKSKAARTLGLTRAQLRGRLEKHRL